MAGRNQGAKALAISADEISARYPILLKDLSGYRFSSKENKGRMVLALRILLKYVECTPRYSDLAAALAAPGARVVCSTDLLKSALEDSYHATRASGFYSEGTSAAFARDAGTMFRWLYLLPMRWYPSLAGRLSLRQEPSGPQQRKNKSGLPFGPISMVEVKAEYGGQFHDDLMAFAQLETSASLMGIRYFCGAMKHSFPNESGSLLRAFKGHRTECDASTISNLIGEFEALMHRLQIFSSATIMGWARQIGRAIDFLSTLKNRNYPFYSKRYAKSAHVPTESRTLADLNIPGVAGLIGAAALRKAIDSVRNEAMATLRLYVEAFEKLAPARKVDRPRAGAPQQMIAIHTVLQGELASLRATGHGQFSNQGILANPEQVQAALASLRSASAWRAVGFEGLLPSNETLSLFDIMKLVYLGIGATFVPCLSAMVVYCTETGWNRQPIDDIPSAVFAFRLPDECGIASASFLSVFKKRAGHNVVALLEHGQGLPLRNENILAAWEEAERSGTWSDYDDRCLLPYVSPAFEAIELLRPLVECLNEFSDDKETVGRFFKHINWQRGVVRVSVNRGIRGTFKTEALSTAGLTFPVIRKTFIQLKLRQVGSIDALRAFSGHVDTKVLKSHYLNSPDVIRELTQSTRFFQNAVQALVSSEVGGMFRFLLSESENEWFYNLAFASGVASAVGYDVASPVSQLRSLVFEPNDLNIRSLLTLHLALKVRRREEPPEKWALFGVPLYGYVLAIERKLREAGLARLSKHHLRQLINDLKAGRATLPTLKLGV
ncbi:hypothetical protein ELH99_17615 [Rhizobium leguminosarum]|uniref:hypothetical protein n=1 Tax=Rhizobium leguminosarum TaxID=384 RepID=UPI00102F6502|nr:hypothetical protein [Rhizobium leguminosarum]TAX51861.1 hypothetical protein ELH99_17615 [Rhizobium leguminosarum]